jgi:hypothetical protein
MLKPITCLLIIYFLIPVLSGVYNHYNDMDNFRKLARQTKRSAIYLKSATVEDLICCVIWSSSFLLYGLTALMYLGVDTVKPLGTALLGIVTVTPIALLAVKFDLVSLIKKHYPWLKWAASIMAIAVTIIASIYADAIVVETTHTRAENLPAAQRLLTGVGALFIYYYILVIICTVVYIAQVINVVVRTNVGKALENHTRAVRIVFRRFPSRMPHRPVKLLNEYALAIGLAFLVLGSLNFVEIFFGKDKLTKTAQGLIVFSSFHTNGEECGLEKKEGVSVSLLPFGKIIVATLLKDGKYDFKPGVCGKG